MTTTATPTAPTTHAVSDLEPEIEQLAERWAAALQAGDVDLWGAQFSADAVCWHSYSGEEMSAAANVELLRALSAFTAGYRYDDVRRRRTRDGYVQQHTLTVTAASGATYRTGVCVVVQVADGRITRIDEYLDSGVVAFGQESAAAAAAAS